MTFFFMSQPSILYNIEGFWITVGITAGIFCLLVILVALCFRSRIAVSIEILKMSSAAVMGIKTSFLFPIVPFVVQVLSQIINIQEYATYFRFS